MDVGRSITFVFDDPGWLKKVLIGGLLFFIPIFGWFAVGGYWLRLVRQVSQGEDATLPEWNDFGGDFSRGLQAFVVALIWALPVISIYIIAAMISALAGSADSVGGALFGGSLYCVAVLLGLVLTFVQPVFISRLAVSGSISDAVEVTAVIDEARRVPVPLLIVLAMQWVLSMVSGFGVILCLVGVIFTTFLSYVMIAHLYGQVRRTLDRGSQAVPTPYA